MKKIISFGIGLIIVGSFCLNAGDMQEDAVREEQDSKFLENKINADEQFDILKEGTKKRVSELKKTIKMIDMGEKDKVYRSCLSLQNELNDLEVEIKFVKNHKEKFKGKYKSIMKRLDFKKRKINAQLQKCKKSYKGEF